MNLSVSPEARPAFVELLHALDDQDRRGRPVPCRVEPEPFTSEDTHERKEAAQACVLACPVLDKCRTYAEIQPEHRFVWAGVDRKRTTKPKNATTTTSTSQETHV